MTKIEPFSSDEAAALSTADLGDNKLQGGGENRWAFSSITNWELWWPGFPVLVYYKVLCDVFPLLFNQKTELFLTEQGKPNTA